MKYYLFIALVIIVAAVMRSSCGACVEGVTVINAVQTQGYSDIHVLDKSIFFVYFSGCSKSDDAVFTLKAKNPKGEEVEILACAGWPFKGVTIRSK